MVQQNKEKEEIQTKESSQNHALEIIKTKRGNQLVNFENKNFLVLSVSGLLNISWE